MVHFPPFASTELCVHSAMAGYCPAGLPHSEIPGSKPVCGSPRLFAAYRVLLRLSAPRHPPCTLSSLTKLELLFFRRILSLLTQFSCQRSIWDHWDPSFTARPRSTSHLSDAPDLTKNLVRRFPPAAVLEAGGADRVRTDDFRLAKAALSQLSYSPVSLARAPGAPRDWWA